MVAALTNFEHFRSKSIGVFYDPEYMTIVNFRKIGAKAVEKMVGNHFVHRQTDRQTDGRTYN